MNEFWVSVKKHSFTHTRLCTLYDDLKLWFSLNIVHKQSYIHSGIASAGGTPEFHMKHFHAKFGLYTASAAAVASLRFVCLLLLFLLGFVLVVLLSFCSLQRNI